MVMIGRARPSKILGTGMAKVITDIATATPMRLATTTNTVRMI